MIVLGELSISDPSALKGFHIESKGFVNDSWAIAVGQNSPEKIIYEIPTSLKFDFYNVNKDVTVSLTETKFKVFLIVHQYYALNENWLSLANGSPSATVAEVQDAMSAECSSNDATVTKFTDGFYGNNLSVKMIFN